eukprot:scaffold358_cov343-Pavlova_lutheri.AAC.5
MRSCKRERASRHFGDVPSAAAQTTWVLLELTRSLNFPPAQPPPTPLRTDPVEDPKDNAWDIQGGVGDGGARLASHEERRHPRSLSAWENEST